LGDTGLLSSKRPRLENTPSKTTNGRTAASIREYSARGLDDVVRRRVSRRN
jgi:hypothetical protein